MNIKSHAKKILGRFGFVILRKSSHEQLMQQCVGSDYYIQKTHPTSRSWDFVKYFSTDANRSQPEIARTGDLGNYSADDHYKAGLKAKKAGDLDLAFNYFSQAIALARHEPSMDEMKLMAEIYYAQSKNPEIKDDLILLRDLLVKTIELNPNHLSAKSDLKSLLHSYEEPDLTKKCFIFYDGTRAEKLHTEAYKRALEYVTLAGVPGDILEFGVLGGWSSRIFSQLMRDLKNYSRIHLFDSFDGLPEYASSVDTESWEINGRKIWSDKMRFPDEFLKQFVTSHEKHIKSRLSEIIRPDRIFIHKGFYSDTLSKDLPIKASIIHIDCDLYQSTCEVLWSLLRMNAFQDGCVILFDDWNCNRASPFEGERLAFQEFLEGQNQYIASPWFSYGYNGMAFFLHENKTPVSHTIPAKK